MSKARRQQLYLSNELLQNIDEASSQFKAKTDEKTEFICNKRVF